MLCDEGLDTFLDDLESAETEAGLWSGVVTFFTSRRVDGLVHIIAPDSAFNGSGAMRILDSMGGIVRRLCMTSSGGRASCAVLGPLLARRRPDLVDLDPTRRQETGWPASDLHLTLVDRGFRTALALPLPSRGAGQGPSGLLLLSQLDAKSFLTLLRTNGACLLLAASHAHDRLLRLAGSESDPLATVMPSLTNREGEVLTLSAQGLTTRELGQRMGISVSAVNFHLANAGRKLSATNRTHAVSRAIALGLIDP